MRLLSQLETVQFTSPIFLWAGGITAFLFLVWRAVILLRKKNKGEVFFSDTSYSFGKRSKKALVSVIFTTVAFLSIIGITSVVLAGPVVEGFENSSTTRENRPQRTIFVAMDVSTSVRDQPCRDGLKQFECLRDELVEFLNQMDDACVSVVFFSDVALPWRRPNCNIESIAHEISKLGMEEKDLQNWSKWGKNPLYIFSGGTNTTRGLQATTHIIREHYAEGNLRSAAIILLTDLDDNRLFVTEEMREIAGSNIRIYVLASAPTSKIEQYREAVGMPDMVYFFDIREAEQLKQAYERITELETTPVLIEQRVFSRHEIRGEVAKALLIFTGSFLFIYELFLRKTRGGE